MLLTRKYDLEPGLKTQKPPKNPKQTNNPIPNQTKPKQS